VLPDIGVLDRELANAITWLKTSRASAYSESHSEQIMFCDRAGRVELMRVL
jgi:hypothetical protein